MTSYYTTHSWRDSVKQPMFEIAQEVGNPMDYLLWAGASSHNDNVLWPTLLLPPSIPTIAASSVWCKCAVYHRDPMGSMSLRFYELIVWIILLGLTMILTTRDRAVTVTVTATVTVTLVWAYAYDQLIEFQFRRVAVISFVPYVLHMRPNKPHCYNKPGVR